MHAWRKSEMSTGRRTISANFLRVGVCRDRGQFGWSKGAGVVGDLEGRKARTGEVNENRGTSPSPGTSGCTNKKHNCFER